MNYEANVFPILNLDKLSSSYRLFEIVGINRQLEEYDANIQHIINKLSYSLQHPVTVINHNDRPHLVIKDDDEVASRVPKEFQVTRNPTVFFTQVEKVIHLDYWNYDEETKEICKRFLGWDMQTQLYRHPKLWQPGSGKPYFQYYAEIQGKAASHKGFTLRVVELPERGFGVCINPTKKAISAFPIKSKMSRDEFKKLQLKGKHVVYRHPQNWYEFKIDEFSDVDVSNFRYPRLEKTISLIDDLRIQSAKPLDKTLANLQADASVIVYKDNKGNHRGAPTALCHLVLDTEFGNGKIHQQSIMGPFQRWNGTRICRNYLQRINFGNIRLEISEVPIECEKKVFLPPDIEFGKAATLSVRNATTATHKTTISNLGKTRKLLLENESAGFYNQQPFDKQFFVMPKSIYDSMGLQFLEDLKAKVNYLYPSGKGYIPDIITYEDRNAENYIDLGYEIVKSISEKRPGSSTSYGVVMIPDYERAKRKHDELGALVVRKLLELDIHVGIMHTDTIQNGYEFFNIAGKRAYRVKRESSGKLSGYTYNVALNKVLLTNHRWPFILATPLHADLTIGIDVKHHTAGFTFVDKYSKHIRPDYRTSKQREKLGKNQLYKYFKKQIADETAFLGYPLNTLVFHRDGRLFSCEKEGILQAIEELSSGQDACLPKDVSVTFVEIPKKSAIPFKLFEVIQNGDQRVEVFNPQIGSYFFLNKSEAFLCTTGREFNRPGTSNPLYVKYNSGSLSFEKVLEDIYALSTLAFSRPEDCTRFPITIKITDRKLSEVASEFNEEELNELLEENNITLS